MSTREERILEVIRERMAAITGAERVEIDPSDEHADRGPYPSIGIVPGETVRLQKGAHTQLFVQMPLTVRGITQASPATPGVGDVPLSPRTVAYALWRQMLTALFPKPAAAGGTYHDRLDGQAIGISYVGHSLFPRDDGGKTYGVYIDCEVDYALHLDNPDL